MAKIILGTPLFYKEEGSNTVYQLLAYNTYTEAFDTHDIIRGFTVTNQVQIKDLVLHNLSFELNDLNTVRDLHNSGTVDKIVAECLHVTDYFQKLGIMEPLELMVRIQDELSSVIPDRFKAKEKKSYNQRLVMI